MRQYEGAPDWPERIALWDIIERRGVSILYTAPTAIRRLQEVGRRASGATDLSSLRLLGSVGEPINPEAWMWYRDTSEGTVPDRRHLVANETGAL